MLTRAECEPLQYRILLAASFGGVLTRGGGGSDRATAMSIAPGGDVVVAGTYNGAINVAPAGAASTLASHGADSVFVARYAGVSALRWAVGLGGSGEQNIQSVVVDPSGNTYIAGYFSGTIDLNPGSGVVTLTSKGYHDVFLLKLNVAGAFAWVRQFGGSGDEGATGLAVDSRGNPYVLGMFPSSGDYDPGAGVSMLSSHGSFDVFAVKLDSKGNFLFAKSVGGLNEDFANGISISPTGDAVVVGTFKGTIDLDPGTAVATRNSAGGKDVFVVKLSGVNGALISAQTFGGSADDQAGDVRVDHAGNILVVGQFYGTGDFNPSTKKVALISAGSTDAFIVKLSPAGAFIWARRWGGTHADRATDLAVDGSNNVIITGQFSGAADFDPGTATATRSTNGANGFYALKLSAAGAFVWAETPQGGNSTNVGEGIGIDGNDVYVAGGFGSTLDFDPGPELMRRTAGGKADWFLWELTGA